MTFETFYATCFVVGLLLSVLSFLLGAMHLHLPGGVHLHGGHIHAHGGQGGRGGSYLNFATVTAFLTWFGGTGYLLTRYSSVWVFLAIVLSTVSGFIGSAIVFWMVFKVLVADDKPLDPADYEMVGVLGKLSSPIREGGVGEIIFSQEGCRRAVAARSETGKPLARGTEVVVTDFKRGIAYVRPWEEMSRMDSAEV
jgi:membrane protein implicated in regulation of membrane protease activity